MEPDELVLSDVHVGRQHIVLDIDDESDFKTSGSTANEEGKYKVMMTRFLFEVPATDLDAARSSSEKKDELSPLKPAIDDDGDLIVTRLPDQSRYKEVITIEHTLGTTLEDVGLQVWQGCLLLCDYLVFHSQLFEKCQALELGAGVGLASIVLARVAKCVFCTDVGQEVLDGCSRNVELNKFLYQLNKSSASQEIIRVRELDWTKYIFEQDKESCYSLRDGELDCLLQVPIIIAADVIYDDGLTEAFFKTVQKLMSFKQPKILYLALEKRLNFTLKDLDVACSAYEHFQLSLKSLQLSKEVTLHVEQLPVDFPQFFTYTRTKYLELWKISV